MRNKIVAGCALLAIERKPYQEKITLSASELSSLITSGGIKNAFYKVCDDGDVVIKSETAKVYDFCGAKIVLKGSLSFVDCLSLTVKNLNLESESVAIKISSSSKNICVSDSNIEGATCVECKGGETSVKSCRLNFSETGVDDSSIFGTFIKNCFFDGTGVGVKSKAVELIVRSCTFNKVITAVEANGVKNALIALNLVKNGEIILSSAINSTVVLNTANKISVLCGSSVYVCENEVLSTLILKNNNYLLADGNKGKFELDANGNDNQNGDTITDVDARLKVGADEKLLPHVDKELFVGEYRRTTVKDSDEGLSFSEYVMKKAAEDDLVIVAPCAYESDELLKFTKINNGVTVYAYGVYAERQLGYDCFIEINEVNDFTIKGLTIAYKMQSSCQAYVLEVYEDTQSVKVITAAGMRNEVGNSDPDFCNEKVFYTERARDFYVNTDTIHDGISEPDEEGARIIKFFPDFFKRIKKGDVLCSRVCNVKGTSGGSTVAVLFSANILLKDITIYGNASAFSCFEHKNIGAVTYYRVLNTVRNGEIIDEETYNYYTNIEKKYGVTTEVYRDEKGRFRGAPYHVGSVDATHTGSCNVGSQCVSCLFENMGDDGTNQQHFSARLADISDNGDGTATLTYKGMISQHTYEFAANRTPNYYCYPFREGDRVYVYTSDGQLVVDTKALSAAEPAGVHQVSVYGTECNRFKVKIASGSVNYKALEKYDLSADDWTDKNKVMVDNMSMASNGFKFDNVLIQSIRSRALLIKASNASVTNCTFRNIGMGCVAATFEIFWGEAGVSENLTVGKNLFDNIGYFGENDVFSPLSIRGLGSKADEEYLLYKNILFEDNVIKNRHTKYAVYINSAKKITVKNNDFGANDEYPLSVKISGAADVELSGNNYGGKDKSDAIILGEVVNIHGTDLE